MKALVVFNDGALHLFNRFLKPGFRHCFCCVLVNGLWLRVEGVNGRPEVRYMTDDSFDLAAFYRNEGFTVLEVETEDEPSLWPFVARSCTGLVKAFLCIRSWALTPHQLYRHLTKA